MHACVWRGRVNYCLLGDFLFFVCLFGLKIQISKTFSGLDEKGVRFTDTELMFPFSTSHSLVCLCSDCELMNHYYNSMSTRVFLQHKDPKLVCKMGLTVFVSECCGAK